MPDAVGSLIGRAAAAACLLPILASSALAQQPHPAPSEQPPASPQFLAHYNMHFAAAALSIDDPRFSWDTRWGGDFDLADYVVGRLNVLADYEAVLGDELRKFDPHVTVDKISARIPLTTEDRVFYNQGLERAGVPRM